jgi:hypothetical protein
MKGIAEKLREKGYDASDIKVMRIQIEKSEGKKEMKPLYSLQIVVNGRKVLVLVGRLKDVK